jgi:hypothetical protein
MNDKNIILLDRAIDSLAEAQDILRILVDQGTLSFSWREIESVIGGCRSELYQVQAEIKSQSASPLTRMG